MKVTKINKRLSCGRQQGNCACARTLKEFWLLGLKSNDLIKFSEMANDGATQEVTRGSKEIMTMGILVRSKVQH
jgi:hypothetical protein